MRIDLSTRIPEAADPGQAAKSGSPSASGGNSLGVDTAKFSSDPEKVQALTAGVTAMPEIRQEKVAALAQAVSSGSYQVTPEQTADAMMSQLGVRAVA